MLCPLTATSCNFHRNPVLMTSGGLSNSSKSDYRRKHPAHHRLGIRSNSPRLGFRSFLVRRPMASTAGPILATSFRDSCARPEVSQGLIEEYKSHFGAWSEPGQLPFVYHEEYNISFWGLEKLHPFDPCKYRKILEMMEKEGVMRKDQVVTPKKALEDSALADVHTKEYIKTVSSSPYAVAMICELAPLALLPNFIVQNKVVNPMRKMAAGTVLAAGLAMEHGWAINLGGGMHHASHDEGMGWSIFDDHMLALRTLRRVSGGVVKQAMYIDLDVHQGNGVCRDKTLFQDKDLYVLDIFNGEIFPGDKRAEAAINCSIPLRCGTSDRVYLESVASGLARAFEECKPDIVMYNAGTDILDGDPLGRFKVSKEGIQRRDEMVFEACLKNKAPVCMALSGGYAKKNAEVISASLTQLFKTFSLLS